MKINIETMQRLSKIKNSAYDAIKIEFLYHSNKLEGSTFTKESLIELLEEKKVRGEYYLDDIIETKNSLELFDSVIDTLKDPFDKYLLWHWHRILKKDSVDEEIGNSGRWKRYGNRIADVDIKLSEPEWVDSRMFNLLEDWKESEKGIYEIADFHQKFEHIHPFQDGNGRIGRFIILRQCIENDVDLIAIDDVYNEEYRKGLYEAQKNNNLQPLIDVFKKCQQRFDQKLVGFKDTIEQVAEEMER